MSYERRQILEMLSSGKISPQDAERLLDKILQTEDRSQGSGKSEGTRSDKAGPSPQYLRLIVTSRDSDVVNLRVPLSLVRTGLGFTSVLPKGVITILADRGVDLSKVTGEDLFKSLQETKLEVDSENGDRVCICCE